MKNVIMVEDLLNGGESNISHSLKLSPLVRWLIDSGAVTGIMKGCRCESPDGIRYEASSMNWKIVDTPMDIALEIRDTFLELIDGGKQVYVYEIEIYPPEFLYNTLTRPGELQTFSSWVRVRAVIV